MPQPPPKAIRADRDRRQSALLTSAVLFALTAGMALGGRSPDGPWLVKMLVVSLTFAVLVWVLRAATPGGAFAGGLICLVIGLASGSQATGLLRSGLTPLIVLFLLTFAATRLGKRRKEAAGLAESRRGRRASQVVANLGMAGLVCSGLPLLPWSRISIGVALLAALAEATADTVSSEIGQAFGGQPFLLTSLRQVAPGTNGAVSLLGTVAGIGSAAILVLIGDATLGLTTATALAALGGGVAGLFFDSVLGATLERRGWLGNDLVNFASTVFAVAMAALLMRL